VCGCDCQNVGRTSLCLQNSIKQHIPKSIRNNKNPPKFSQNGIAKKKINATKSPQRDLAIGNNLLQNIECANNYNDQQSFILARARSAFHLSALKATYIKPSNQFYVVKNNSSTFTNFSLVSIFSTTLAFPTNYRFLCVSDLRHNPLNQSISGSFNGPYTATKLILAFYSS